MSQNQKSVMFSCLDKVQNQKSVVKIYVPFKSEGMFDN